MAFNAKRFLLAAVLWTTPALAATDIVMHRDPGCGCCEKWAAEVRAAFGRNVRIIDDAHRAEFDRRLGVPASLGGCHTAIIDGMAFEGHVPIADMKRVLSAKPNGVRGLAVAGMPMGSLGMEMPGMQANHYNVVAFGTGRSFVYSRH
ncbi:hypothetical protein GGQ88_003328 [Novosphingobium hassiacum]|uniref:DUF411 domain-containing protein n=1 Tax=Novosphingobium hassiacum TaxID=173676 RepID=A0A7W6A0Q9_9SPHN|nr:DUF411 domain-containing protein [Novosphingobium hassiacum]MBB3862034.1 hypothetical protein [Novosphingobium hassiacum]